MARLVNKFNVLLKSSVNSVLKDITSRGKHDPQTPRLGKDADKDLARLRQQIDSALDHEDRTVAELEKMARQIAEWDQQADAAIQAGDNQAARQLVQKIQRTQQRRALLEADLDQHRRSTSELIRRVNEYEAVIAEARTQNTPDTPQPATNTPDEDTASFSERLRKARQRATQPRQEEAPVHTAAPPVNEDQLDEQAIEDDLARRRNRLSM